MIFYDVNYSQIRDKDKVKLDCSKCDCLNTDEEIECITMYDDEKQELVFTDVDFNTYRFKYSDCSLTLTCVEIIENSRNDDEERLF